MINEAKLANDAQDALVAEFGKLLQKEIAVPSLTKAEVQEQDASDLKAAYTWASETKIALMIRHMKKAAQEKANAAGGGMDEQ